ncbi:MAG: hypothetical protein Q7J28_05195 [Caulobacter sp.]|nr:hypothetical protein [Caulobacter sp.]
MTPDEAGQKLTQGQLEALRNLERKHAGGDVDWIRISDALSLTELGLALRNREGWVITPAGLQVLDALAPDGPPRADPDAPVPIR